jgi:hypothetical protein
MFGKNGIFRGKSCEKSFFQDIPRNFPRKVIFCGKKCTKNRPLVALPVAPSEIWSQYCDYCIYNYLQHKRCNKLERFVQSRTFSFKTHQAISCVVIF